MKPTYVLLLYLIIMKQISIQGHACFMKTQYVDNH